jgi:hypothetical protein
MSNDSTPESSAKDAYARRLRLLTDAELRSEWTHYRRQYDPLRTELAQRRMIARDLRTRKLSYLINGQRMREAIAKLKQTNGEEPQA